MYTNPKIMTSPISGQPVKPLIKSYINDHKEITEAHYIDPATGAFIRKGIISVKDLKTGQMVENII